MVSPRTRAGLVGVLGVVAVTSLTACTSSDDGTTSPSVPGSPSATASATSAPATSAPAGLAPVDGAYLVVGRTEDAADVYRVSSGRLQRVTTGAHVTSVSADDGVVVVGREQGGKELVQQLTAGRPTSLGITSGFSPAVSDDGALAWVSVGRAASTPGVTKPGGFVVHARSSLTGRDRQLASFTSSVGGLQWTDDGLVAAVAAGNRARLVRIPGSGGTPRTLATITGGADLDVTASEDAGFTVSSGDGAVIVSGSTQTPFATGWRPLCWSDDDEVLATRGGRLATVAIDGRGRSATPRVLGSLPAGTSAYGGSCD